MGWIPREGNKEASQWSSCSCNTRFKSKRGEKVTWLALGALAHQGSDGDPTSPVADIYST